jgi:hypothetical protein
MTSGSLTIAVSAMVNPVPVSPDRAGSRIKAVAEAYQFRIIADGGSLTDEGMVG